MPHQNCLKLSEEAKSRLKILFLAKWAESDGRPDKVDGTHATYHHDVRETLKKLGFNVEAASTYNRLFSDNDYDFLFTLLNRGGFTNSEMLAPLLSTYNEIPYFGATPIIRGLGDDKHLMKLAAERRGLTTPPWEIYRRGSGLLNEPTFDWQRLIVKPNASSASWGIIIVETWAEAVEHIKKLHTDDHDVIVEKFIDGYELAVPVVGGKTGAWVLPVVRFFVDDPHAVRSYEEKRHLKPTDGVELRAYDNDVVVGRLEKHARDILNELWPYDYGRMEFKYDEETDTLYFLEINLSCNLWRKKAVPFSATLAGVTYEELLETILCYSMLRQGVIAEQDLI